MSASYPVHAPEAPPLLLPLRLRSGWPTGPTTRLLSVCAPIVWRLACIEVGRTPAPTCTPATLVLLDAMLDAGLPPRTPPPRTIPQKGPLSVFWIAGVQRVTLRLLQGVGHARRIRHLPAWVRGSDVSPVAHLGDVVANALEPPYNLLSDTWLSTGLTFAFRGMLPKTVETSLFQEIHQMACLAAHMARFPALLRRARVEEASRTDGPIAELWDPFVSTETAAQTYPLLPLMYPPCP